MKKGIFAMTMALTLGLGLINTGCGGDKAKGGDSAKKGGDSSMKAPEPTPTPPTDVDTSKKDSMPH